MQNIQRGIHDDGELQDDIIDIIAMNASGLWRGACAGRVGNFKFVLFLNLLDFFKGFDLIAVAFRFVNVEILPPRERRRSRSRSLRRVKRRPRTIAEVMRVRKTFFLATFFAGKNFFS